MVNLVAGQGKDMIMEVNCTTDPIADLYSFEASLKLVSQDM